MKYTSKKHFIELTEERWQELWEQIEGLSEAQLIARHVIGKSERAESVKDVMAHLYAWHRMASRWYRDGLKGKPDLPLKGYKWSQTREINADIFETHRDDEFASLRLRLKRSHRSLMSIVEERSETELLARGHYDWTGKLSLASYLGPNLASHYGWAIKRIKAMKKLI